MTTNRNAFTTDAETAYARLAERYVDMFTAGEDAAESAAHTCYALAGEGARAAQAGEAVERERRLASFPWLSLACDALAGEAGAFAKRERAREAAEREAARSIDWAALSAACGEALDRLDSADAAAAEREREADAAARRRANWAARQARLAGRA